MPPMPPMPPIPPTPPMPVTKPLPPMGSAAAEGGLWKREGAEEEEEGVCMECGWRGEEEEGAYETLLCASCACACSGAAEAVEGEVEVEVEVEEARTAAAAMGWCCMAASAATMAGY